ncbi:MAG: hypothetical protein ACLR76_06000 [Alistipes sp.]
MADNYDGLQLGFELEKKQ